MNKSLIGLLTSSIVVLAMPAMSQNVKALKASEDNKKVWISIGSDAVNLINKNPNKQFLIENIQPTQQVFTQTKTNQNSNNNSIELQATDNINVLSIPSSQIGQLSEFMHEEFNRCGGFIHHDSLAAALSYTDNAANVLPQNLFNYTIDNPTGVNSLLNQLSSSNLAAMVNTLSAYNNRYYTSTTGKNAAIWLKDHWTSISSGRSDISVDLYSHSWQQSSVIATITGTSNSSEVVIVGGHLDSINSSSPSSGRAPGADDNASGISVVTETLRAIVASGFKPKRTIKFIGYAAEEVGLRGSGAIAQDYKSQGINVVGVAQFDMTGFKGTSNKDIVFMTDYTNSAQNTFMTQLIDTYLSDINYGFDQCGYGCSDHASWHNQGFPASMPFESTMSDINRSIHTSSDASFNSAHALNFASGDVVVPPDVTPLDNNVVMSVSGASKEESMYSFDVPADATSLAFNTYGGTGDADLFVKFGSKPTLTNSDCSSTTSTSSEECLITNIQTGKYYVMVQAWNAINNVNLIASYETGTTIPDNELKNGVPVSGLNGAKNEDLEYEMHVPAGATNIRFSISGGTGDADLFVKFASKPTSTNFDCRPYLNGNNESCNALTNSGNTYYIKINGYRAFTGVTLTGSYD